MSTKTKSACTPYAHQPAEPGNGRCPHCEHPRCKGTTGRRTGTPARCRKQPIKGADVCRTHGGSAPQVRDAAARRLAERQAVLAAETFGLPREIDPHSALLEELHRTAGAVQWLGAVVADIEQKKLTWGRTKESSGEDSGTTTWESRPNAYVELWHRERKHLLVVSKTCIDVGIEERRVRVAEAAGQQLAGVVRAVLERLELSEEQQVRALSVVPEEFRRLSESGQVVKGEVAS